MLLSVLSTQQEKLLLLSKGITAPPQIKFHHTVLVVMTKGKFESWKEEREFATGLLVLL